MPTRTTILYIQPVAERGGSDQALVRMVRTLPRESFDCHVAVPAASPMQAELEAAGATVHVVPMHRLTGSGGARYWMAYVAAWPLTVLRLVRLGRRVHADVIHSNSLHSLYGWAVARLLRRPHVWHAREIVVQSAAALRLERLLARRFATVVVAISDAVAATLDLPNVEVVLDDIDPGEFTPRRAGRFRSGAGIGEDVPLVGFVGRIDVWKGIDVVLDALPLVRRQVPDVQLVVAGPVVAGKEALAAALEDEAGAVGGVHWVGPRDDVPDLLADLDVLAAPSTFPEPFGLVLIEALASGVPAVSSNIGGPVEIASRVGDAARLVPPNDAAALAAAIVAQLDSPNALTRPRADRRPLWTARPPDWPAFYHRLQSHHPRRTLKG
jgi:glycosyltransferase involved in cell wall biosynthesis